MDDFAIGYVIHRFFYRTSKFFEHCFAAVLFLSGYRSKAANIGTNLIFDDPRLRMTIAGRFLVRVVTYLSLLFLFAAMATFLISGVVLLFFVGILLALFFVDFAVHREGGDRPIGKLPTKGSINVAHSITPKAFLVLEKALDRALLTRQDFLLLVADWLAANPQIQEALRRLDVKPEEFREKLDELLGEKKEGVVSKTECLTKANALALDAFGVAAAGRHNFIKIPDLFFALLKVEDETLRRLFDLFSITAGDLEVALILASRQITQPRNDVVDVSGAIPTGGISALDAEKVLAYESLILERKTGVTISFAAIKRAVVVAKKIFPDHSLPDGALRLLKSALVSAEQRGEKMLGPDRISAVAEAKAA